MSTTVSEGLGPFDASALRRNWGWFFVLGVLEIILGTIAIGASVVATVVTVVFFGWLLLIGGVLSAVHAFWRKQWRGFFLDLVTGVLYAVAGFLMVAEPLAAAASLTLLIAMLLLIGGIFRIVVALSGHLEHWGWVLLNGVITAALGVMIWRQWPSSALWVIGMFIGIEMIFYGWSLVMLSLIAKGAVGPAGAPAR
ncbi:MAG TPA: DUF308 domain-containing protein [Planctomycetaceae bacterium]|jgi:uncharacterized membrane protein HdeD (DUF308 family)|nr:DUF308 domain-containing protein [Planctomycetaceae bacterium]